MTMTEARTRLPVPPGVDHGLWRVLTEVVFPNASDPSKIVLAMEYCRARNLDILKKPVNIVPMWSSEQGRNVETIWPSINETQITAARSKEWAGLDPARYGNKITETFTGRRKGKAGWEDAHVTVAYPEWCDVTVYRMVGGQRQPFTERAYWLESYGRLGGSILPNPTWTKRPYGQISKVAKAAALRAAFPEEESGTPTDEEMHGLTIEDANVAQHEPAHAKLQPLQQPAPPTAPEETIDPDTGEVLTPKQEVFAPGSRAIPVREGETWQEWGQRYIALVRQQTSLTDVDDVMAYNVETFARMKEEMPKMAAGLERSINQHKVTLLPKDEVGPLQ